jgi:hypothetical protein
MERGDHIFVISGKIPQIDQFIMGGFEIEAKIDVNDAYRLFPEQRLGLLPDGQLTGNVIVDATGRQHELDNHKSKSFDRRIKNYVIGTNLLALSTPQEIVAGRSQTLEVLRQVLQKEGKSPRDIVTRFGTSLSERQVLQLREWLAALKRSSN